MLNKNDIVKKLTIPLFAGKEYWVLTGAAMVLYGVKDDTKDIDLGASSRFIDELISHGYGYSYCDDGTRKICFEEFEIFENWIFDSVKYIKNIPVISLKGLIELKEDLGREKDLNDIRKIKELNNVEYKLEKMMKRNKVLRIF